MATAYRVVSKSPTKTVRPSVLTAGLASPAEFPSVKFHCCFLLSAAQKVTVMFWWHANKCPMHRFADPFDDVFSTAVVTG